MQWLAKSPLLCLTLGAMAWARQDSSAPPPPENRTSSAASAPGAAGTGSQPTDSRERQAGSEPKPEPPSAPQTERRNSGPRKRRRQTQATASEPAPAGETRRVVIRRGGVGEPSSQIVPGMSAEESGRVRQETQDLLAAADADMKTLASRTLATGQKETLSQIQHYMNVARAALKEGDIQRAHTLARKAQLLSEDLVKH